MKKALFIFSKYFIIWLAYFILAKIVFLLYNHDQTSSLTFHEITGVFIHGFIMDLSMVSYLMLIPGLLLSFLFIIPTRIFYGILHGYALFLIVVISFLNILDLGLYPHWGTRVGISAFDYFNDPKGMISNVTLNDMILAIVVFLAFVISFFIFFKRFLNSVIEKSSRPKWFVLPVMLFFTASLFIPIRGGLGTTPINLSTVSFSNKQYANHASYNFLWYFFKTIERHKVFENPCIYMDIHDANNEMNQVVQSRTMPDSAIIKIDLNNKPNVILIILESFSNKVIGALGGKYPVTPNLDSLCNNGIVFSSMYASGNRSDRGLAALLGGYPSLLSNSVINFPDKSSKLIMLSHYFKNNGYTTSFYYGGDINFYNLKSFVLQGQFNQLVTVNDFPYEMAKMSSWGVPDGYLFDRVLQDIKASEPFFTVAYTLSSHPPYDVPYHKFEGESNEAKYLNSVAYTDSCVGAFVQALKEKGYWENSLVIVTADHGALQPGPTDITEPDTYLIPMIWTGGVVKNHAQIDEIGSQTDIMPTLIRQFGWEVKPSLFGRDIFSDPQYAFYMCNTGWGYVTREGQYFYDQNAKSFNTFLGSDMPQPGFDFAKAYLQVLHNDFLKK